ncbi:MAG: hypothetical protein ACMG6S_17285, partial [Byssovorax sp.]
TSGVTLGAGYDMGQRSATEIKADLIGAGVSAADAALLSGGAGKKGSPAKEWVDANVATLPKITKDVAKSLYELIYPEYVDRAKKVVAEWGGNWDVYSMKMKEVLVDLKYRGSDLGDTHKPHLIHSIKNADYNAFCAAIHNLDYWQEHTNLKRQKAKGPGGTYLKDQRGGYNWRLITRSDYLDKAATTASTYTEPQKTAFSLRAMSQDQLYDHLKTVWQTAQERFGNKGKAEFDFQEADGRLNLLGARGFEEATLKAVPSTNTRYDDTLLAIYKKDGKKHVDTFAFSSEWTHTGSTSVLVLGQHKYYINVHKKDRTYVKLSSMATLADYQSEYTAKQKSIGYRALNPDPSVPTVHQSDSGKVGAVGHQTTDLHNLTTINIHYGGEGLVVNDPSRGWSDGCQVISGWNNYIRFMRIVEADTAIKGSSGNELEAAGSGTSSLIYTLVEGDSLQPQQLGVSFPVSVVGDLKVNAKSAAAMYDHTEKESPGGYYPLGTNRTWHGGVHLRAGKRAPVVAGLDGRIIAARLAAAPEKSMGFFGNTNFILMKHEVSGAALNIANAFDEKTLVGYTVRATSLFLRTSPGKSGSTEGLVTLHMGDEVLLKEKKHDKVDGLFWAHVTVKRSSVAGAEKKEGYVSADPQHVNPLYGQPEELFKPTDKKTFYTLYMHLAAEELVETSPVFAATAWIHRDRYVVLADELNLRGTAERPAQAPDSNVLGKLAKGDKLTQRSAPIPDAKDKKLIWVKVAVAQAGNASLKHKEGFVALGDKYLKKVREPSQWFLNTFRDGTIVKLDDKVKAGSQLWIAGVAGAGVRQSDTLHWEIFSEENLFPKWKTSEDADDNLNMDTKAIHDMVEQEVAGFDDNLSVAELQAFYKENPKSKLLRRWACKFMSEWGVDVDTAVDQMSLKQSFYTQGLADQMRPYSFWKEAKAAKVELPESPKVWHYNPITFMYALSRALEGPAQPSGPPPAPKETPEQADAQLSGASWVKKFPTSTALA